MTTIVRRRLHEGCDPRKARLVGENSSVKEKNEGSRFRGQILPIIHKLRSVPKHFKILQEIAVRREEQQLQRATSVMTREV